MKLNKFDTLVEGHPVYDVKLSRNGQYIMTGLLILCVTGLVYWKFIRTPKFRFINKDVLKNRIQFKMDNSDKIYYVNGGEKINIGKSTIIANLIKQSDSDLIEGIEITQKKGDEILKTQKIIY